MARDRLAALAVIRRLADQRLEQDATALTALRGRIAGLQAAKAQLRHKAAHEGSILSAEAAPYVVRFLRSVRAEEVRLDSEIARLAQAAAQQEHIVRESFREARVMGRAEAGERASRKAEAARREVQTLDDFAVMRPRA